MFHMPYKMSIVTKLRQKSSVLMLHNVKFVMKFILSRALQFMDLRKRDLNNRNLRLTALFSGLLLNLSENQMFNASHAKTIPLLQESTGRSYNFQYP